MPGHDTITIQIFNSEIQPEDIPSRASKVTQLLAQGLLRRLTENDSDKQTRHHSPSSPTQKDHRP